MPSSVCAVSLSFCRILLNCASSSACLARVDCSSAAFSLLPSAALFKSCPMRISCCLSTFCPCTNKKPLAPSAISESTSAPVAMPRPPLLFCWMTMGCGCGAGSGCFTGCFTDCCAGCFSGCFCGADWATGSAGFSGCVWGSVVWVSMAGSLRAAWFSGCRLGVLSVIWECSVMKNGEAHR